MRNLSISSVATWSTSSSVLDTQSTSSNVSAVTFDMDEQVVYAALENDAGLESSSGNNHTVQSIQSIQISVIKVEAGILTTALESYSSVEQAAPTYPKKASKLLSFQFLAESRLLVLVLANGEILRYPVDEGGSDGPGWDLVGAFEGGLEAATWSPDETLLVLATTDGKLVQMTVDFEALHEKTLRPLEFGQDAQVNINWGSKATQFHGSLGKSAALAQPEAIVGSSPNDDGRVRISWRGDAAHFVVSTLDPYESTESPTHRRVIRVYDRDTVLLATLEPTPGLEHAISWRPSGNFIATSQKFFGPDTGHLGGGIGRPGRHDIVFFERNGLRRAEIDGRWNPKVDSKDTKNIWSYKVKEISWSCDSNLLGVWVEKEDTDIFQLWTTGNWHWYLKLELRPKGSNRFTSFQWHPEKGRTLLLASAGHLCEYQFEYETCTSVPGAPDDLGMVAVVDGGNALLTPFRIQNVPPPMGAHTLAVSDDSNTPPTHQSLSPSGDALATISYTQDGQTSIPSIDLWALQPRTVGGRGKIMKPKRICHQTIAIDSPYQILLRSASTDEWRINVLGEQKSGEGLLVEYKVKGGELVELCKIECQKNGRLIRGGVQDSLLWQSQKGALSYVSSDNQLLPFSSLPSFCFKCQCATIKNGPGELRIVIGLSGNKLYITSQNQAQAILVGSNATSFVTSGAFLIYVSSNHESIYVPLEDIASVITSHANEDSVTTADYSDQITALSSNWEKRRVERGSRIVTAIPTAMNVVLQMPRGNLETITPRPLALEVIRSNITRLEYNKAFAACRKHRIDHHIIIEQDPKLFTDNTKLFVEQITDVDDLNLFLTTIGRWQGQKDLVAQICDGIRTELEARDPMHYLNAILTSFVVKTPPDYEAALSHLHKLRENNAQVVEDAVRYIIFLVDADKLFDIALGMYDFTLVLLIAQHSQRDPREYLPFLRELRALDDSYQKFKIDDHLKRYSKALRNLANGGPKYFDEALRYTEKHQLYVDALKYWAGQEKEHKIIMESYADWLFDRRELIDAARAYEIAKKPLKAMAAYEKAHAWQPLFTLAVQQDLTSENLSTMAYRVAEELCTRKRWSDGARVYLDYASDIPEAVRALSNGNDLDEALRICAKNGRSDLIEDVIHSVSLDLVVQMFDDLQEMDDQLKKQYARLQELRKNKADNLNAYLGIEDPSLHNVDVMTDVSTPFSTFTRYTMAPTSTSRSISKRTSRSKRKLDMKNAAGRRGTVEEESYILASWGKLVTRLTGLQAEAGKLLPHLMRFSAEHREEGTKLQEAVINLEDKFRTMVDEIWVVESPPPDQQTEPVPAPTSKEASRPTKPEFAGREWVPKSWL